MSKELTCYCYGDGTLEFTTDKLPDGTLAVAKSEDWSKLKDTIEVLATHAYKGDNMCIGGVRTAEIMGDDPIAKLTEFKAYVEKNLNR